MHENELIHVRQIPIVRCVCGYDHALSRYRNNSDKNIICHLCFRHLFWQGNKPIAVESIVNPAQNNSHASVERKVTELEIVGHKMSTEGE